MQGSSTEYLLGEKGKDRSEKGRELKERNAFLSFPPPPSKISSPLAP